MNDKKKGKLSKVLDELSVDETKNKKTKRSHATQAHEEEKSTPSMAMRMRPRRQKVAQAPTNANKKVIPAPKQEEKKQAV